MPKKKKLLVLTIRSMIVIKMITCNENVDVSTCLTNIFRYQLFCAYTWKNSPTAITMEKKKCYSLLLKVRMGSIILVIANSLKFIHSLFFSLVVVKHTISWRGYYSLPTHIIFFYYFFSLLIVVVVKHMSALHDERKREI